MTEEDERRLYYEYRVRLTTLIAKRDRLVRRMQSKIVGKEDVDLATEDGELMGQIDELTAEIVATTKLANDCADRIGSPRAREQDN